MARKYRSNKTEDTIRPAYFVEFLRSYINPEDEDNPHWTNYVYLARPCNFSYQFIFKLEDIEYESDWFLRHLKIDLIYPKGYSSDVDKENRTQTYLRDIDKSLLLQVYQKLEIDYKLFNYPIPWFFRELI